MPVSTPKLLLFVLTDGETLSRRLRDLGKMMADGKEEFGPVFNREFSEIIRRVCKGWEYPIILGRPVGVDDMEHFVVWVGSKPSSTNAKMTGITFAHEVVGLNPVADFVDFMKSGAFLGVLGAKKVGKQIKVGNAKIVASPGQTEVQVTKKQKKKRTDKQVSKTVGDNKSVSNVSSSAGSAAKVSGKTISRDSDISKDRVKALGDVLTGTTGDVPLDKVIQLGLPPRAVRGLATTLAQKFPEQSKRMTNFLRLYKKWGLEARAELEATGKRPLGWFW